MDKTFLTRIVTFMAYPDIYGTPKTLLVVGSRTVHQGEKERVFVIRRVFYDDSMTPMYATPEHVEKRYVSLAELREKNPNNSPIFDSPILDLDHSLKVYEP